MGSGVGRQRGQEQSISKECFQVQRLLSLLLSLHKQLMTQRLGASITIAHPKLRGRKLYPWRDRTLQQLRAQAQIWTLCGTNDVSVVLLSAEWGR
jgi:hypothetical protein